jgi:hypothetical protein
MSSSCDLVARAKALTGRCRRSHSAVRLSILGSVVLSDDQHQGQDDAVVDVGEPVSIPHRFRPAICPDPARPVGGPGDLARVAGGLPTRDAVAAPAGADVVSRLGLGLGLGLGLILPRLVRSKSVAPA